MFYSIKTNARNKFTKKIMFKWQPRYCKLKSRIDSYSRDYSILSNIPLYTAYSHHYDYLNIVRYYLKLKILIVLLLSTYIHKIIMHNLNKLNACKN